MDHTHTPGPWTVGIHRLVLAQINSDTIRIAQTFKDPAFELPRGIARGEAEANARLIAAAPEMLDALEHISTWLIAPDLSNETLAMMAAGVRATIAKAKGNA